MSSGLGMTYPKENAPQNPLFDNVFVNPESYRAFMKTGAWPDKTVLIKENRSAETKVSVNRDGRVQTGVVSIEANSRTLREADGCFMRSGKTAGRAR